MIVSAEQLETVLRNVKGNTFARLTARTKCDVRKDSTLAGKDVRKLSSRSVSIGFTYAKSVNRQRVREDKDADFVAHPRKWGKRVRGTPLVEHNGKVYLECKVEKVFDYRYEVDGKIADTQMVEACLRDRGRNDRQELDKPVVLRDFALESIVCLAMNGRLYELREQRAETLRVTA